MTPLVLFLLILGPFLGAKSLPSGAAVSDSSDKSEQVATSSSGSQKRRLKLKQEKAKTLFEAKKYDEALQIILEQQSSLTVEGYLLLGAIYNQLGNRVKEKATLEEMMAKFPSSGKGTAQLGTFYFRESTDAKNNEEILRLSKMSFDLFRKAIELEPERKGIYERLSEAFDYYQYNYELRVLTEDMMKKFGKSPLLLSRLCRLNAQDNFFKVARKKCLEAIEADSSLIEPYIYLALIETNQQNDLKAEKILRKAHQRFPKSELVASNLGELLRQKKNWEDSEKLYEKACLNGPDSFRSQMGLAKISFQLKHYEKALAALTNACRLQPNLTHNTLKFFKDYLRLSKDKTNEDKYQEVLNQCQIQMTKKDLPVLKATEKNTTFAIYSRIKLDDFH